MTTLYARSEHGGYRVFPVGNTLKVEWPQGERVYRSSRQAIIALVNQAPDPSPSARDPKWSFDRYFRRGKYCPEPDIKLDVFDLFKPDPPNQIVVAVKPTIIKPDRSLIVHVPEKGIDLDRRGNEVRKLFYAGFARQVSRRGYDPEDVLQEVYKGILVRNSGKCPFDASKSSFAHYVHMVCGCIISNYYRRYKRLETNEVFGVTNLDGDEIDVAEADLETTPAIQEERAVYESAKSSLITRVVAAAREQGIIQSRRASAWISECFDLLVGGMRVKEIAEALKREASEVSNVVQLIKKVASGWRLEVQF